MISQFLIGREIGWADNPVMNDVRIYLLLAGMLLLAGFGAFRSSRSTHAACLKYGAGWARALSVLAFIIAFAGYSFAMGLVLGMFFGR